MSRSNQVHKKTRQDSDSNGWVWLQSRLEIASHGEATQELRDWMNLELDRLEDSYSDLITNSSRKHAAGLLTDQRRA